MAALTRAKKLPRLEQLMAKASVGQRPRQTWQEQFQIMRMWAAKQQQAIRMRQADGG